MQAAEGTVRAYFAVKSQAADDLSVQIDAQEPYLTARDVHPGAAYEAGWRGHPTGVTDMDSRVELSDSRWVGDDIQIDFELTGTNLTYPVEGTELQLEAGAPGEFYWTGTATLENRDGVRGSSAVLAARQADLARRLRPSASRQIRTSSRPRSARIDAPFRRAQEPDAPGRSWRAGIREGLDLRGCS